MTPEQTKLVTDSFARIFARKAPLAQTFYAELFTAHPDLRELFPPDMSAQYQKLTDLLAYVVRHLSRPDALLPSVRDLAWRHVRYGALPEHYPAVGAALIAALQKETPGTLTPEEEAAWISAYELVAREMLGATGR